jgi:hypothetical protein
VVYRGNVQLTPGYEGRAIEALTTVVEDPYRPLYTEAFVVALLVYLSIPQSVKSSGLGFCVPWQVYLPPVVCISGWNGCGLTCGWYLAVASRDDVLRERADSYRNHRNDCS